MIKNYFKIAVRNLWKNKGYSFINIFGLTIGILSAAFIFLWVEDETTYNHNFIKRDYLYRVMENQKNDGKISTSASTPGPMAESIKAEIPGIKNTGRLSWEMDELAVFGDKSIKERGAYVDPSILTMLSLPFVKGDARTAFKELQSVVISETFAKKMFEDEDPIGKTIKMNANQGYSVDGPFTVTGVYTDFPKNSSYQFQWLSPYKIWENKNKWLIPWDNNLTETLVELNQSATVPSVNQKLENYLSTKVSGVTTQCFLFSMNDWNLRNHFENGEINGGKIKYIHLFSLIAAIILLIACINFMNLATARSDKRAKEVGVLKVVGAHKKGLIGKFISESLIMAFVAVVLAIGAIYLLLPFYNNLVEKELSIDIFKPLHFIGLIATGVITGVMGGIYPAFFLSSFNPIKALKGVKIKNSLGVIFIRKGLVIAQFAVSAMLIIGALVIYQQIQHIKNRNLGFNKNNLIYMDVQENVKDHFSTVKNKLLATGYVENVALSEHNVLEINSYGEGFSWQGKDPNNKISIRYNFVGPDYLSTMQMPLLEGREFYNAHGVDSSKVIINKSMAKLMGKQGKIGSLISTNDESLQVVGIIEDFVYNDMYGPVTPLIMFCNPSYATRMNIRYKPNIDLTEALAKTESLMKVENPGYPFDYKFIDEDFNQFFATETLIGKLAGVFAALAIFISCLGLFGLAAYTAERRTKELGVRKVLGASVHGLAGLLSKEFLQLVVISCLVAYPISWWAMETWLQDYEYRISLHWWVFLAAGIALLVIALLTISFQAIKAAIANPVKSLRTE